MYNWKRIYSIFTSNIWNIKRIGGEPMTYLIYRCNCGRVLYSKEGVKHHKCTCGRNLEVKKRRVLKKAQTSSDATHIVQDMQEEIYGGTGFMRADEL